MNAWLVGAPYVFGGLLVVHGVARLLHRLMEGGWRFEDGTIATILHILAAGVLWLSFLLLVMLPATIGMEMAQ